MSKTLFTKGKSMSEERQQKLLGLICTIIGAVFVLAGIVIFFMSNHMNFQMKKTEATIVAMYAIETIEGEMHTMTELSYRVGSELVFASYEYPGILSEETLTLDVFYNIKEPSMVFQGEWLWQPLLVLVLGVPILITGLYYWGIINFDAWKLSVPDASAGTTQKELYKAKKSTVENILPMVAGILFIAFGIIMLVTREEWWAWLFIVIGAVELLYIGMEFVPALITWISLSRLNKLKKKAKAYDVEVTEDISIDEKASPAEKMPDDELEPFEIKTLKKSKKKKSKRK